jgi:legumain
MALLLLTALLVLSGLAQGWDGGILMPTEKESKLSGKEEGVRWAILVAGSYGYGNYRHQVDFLFAFLGLYAFWICAIALHESTSGKYNCVKLWLC